ncbi:MAG: hypothetical protein ACRD7E_19155 [Bryobacteraceae bacterium]
MACSYRATISCGNLTVPLGSFFQAGREEPAGSISTYKTQPWRAGTKTGASEPGFFYRLVFITHSVRKDRSELREIDGSGPVEINGGYRMLQRLSKAGETDEDKQRPDHEHEW